MQKRLETRQQPINLEYPRGHWEHGCRRQGEIDTGNGTRTPEESLNIAQQLQAANKRIKELEKKNRELEKLNDFLEEASAFFAASRRKSGKEND